MRSWFSFNFKLSLNILQEVSLYYIGLELLSTTNHQIFTTNKVNKYLNYFGSNMKIL